MAVSNLLPRKARGNRTRKQTLQERMAYDRKDEKTEGGELVSAYMCSPETAAEEFEMAKLIYETTTGRSQPREKDIIAYRIIQSFQPGEITAEDANRTGYELAMQFTKGKHQFVVSTHTDRAHIHNHIEFNSTNLECDGKFNNFKNSSFALRELNDKICREHGYSVIENPKARGQQFQEKAAAGRGRSFKERLRRNIDRLLPGCKDFEEFLSRMRAEGYEVKRRGKSLEFRALDQEKFTRSYRLGEDYTEAALRGRIAGTWELRKEAVSENATPGAEGEKQERSAGTGRAEQKSAGAFQKEKPREKPREKHSPTGKKVNLLVDIQAKLQAGKGKGYERWAKVFNLKEASRTLNFLTENGVTDYGELAARAEAAGEKFDALAARVKQLEGRMAETARLKTHIINYARTRDIYREYRKSRNPKAYRAEHLDEIEKHEAAKAAFDALQGKPIPKAAQLSEEYGKLQAEKRACYEEYKKARQDMIDYQTAKANVEKILNMERQEQQKEGQKKRERKEETEH